MALGKCISIENTTATLEDCDGSSEVRRAGFSLSSWAQLIDDAGVPEKCRVWHIYRSLEKFIFAVQTIINL